VTEKQIWHREGYTVVIRPPVLKHIEPTMKIVRVEVTKQSNYSAHELGASTSKRLTHCIRANSAIARPSRGAPRSVAPRTEHK
jgi:hypothetical protein